MPDLTKASVAALQKELERKRQRVARLTEKRQSIAERIVALDSEIAGLRGPTEEAKAPVEPAKPERPKPKAKTEKGKPGRRPVLAEAIHGVLAEADGPMRAGDIAEALKKRKFKTKSADLTNLVREAMSRIEGVKRVGRGLYAVTK